MRAALLAVTLVLLAAVPGAGVTTPGPVPAGRPVDVPAFADGPVTLAAYPGNPGDPATAAAFLLPVPPPAVVLTPFRPPPTRYGAGHRGVDLAAPAGTTIRAAADGTVVYAGNLAGRGVVSVQHAGGLRTTYEPVRPTVRAGQPVTAGAMLGTLQPGHPSCAPADCLHWGARLPDGSYLDPMSLLHPWRVRLKPWDGGG
jgi:murein DD-endopeptidase MepM/ murein hydrolase activator NlpD